jgi:hypothetical protein
VAFWTGSGGGGAAWLLDDCGVGTGAVAEVPCVSSTGRGGRIAGGKVRGKRASDPFAHSRASRAGCSVVLARAGPCTWARRAANSLDAPERASR